MLNQKYLFFFAAVVYPQYVLYYVPVVAFPAVFICFILPRFEPCDRSSSKPQYPPPPGPGTQAVNPTVPQQGLSLAESTGYAYPSLAPATGAYGEVDSLVHSHCPPFDTRYERVAYVSPSFATGIRGTTSSVFTTATYHTAGCVNLNLPPAGTPV